MSQVVVRIELHGDPNGDIYDELHEYMEENDWLRTLIGGGGTASDMPHAMYQASYVEPDPDLGALVENLENYINKQIWEGTTILAMRVEDWAISEME